MNRYVSIGGGLIAATSLFLPFLTVMGITLSGIKVHGATAWFLIIIGLISAVIGFLDKRWWYIVSLFLGLIIFFFGVKDWADADDLKVPSGLGIYLLQIGGFITLVGAIWGLVKKRIASAATPAV